MQVSRNFTEQVVLNYGVIKYNIGKTRKRYTNRV